MSSSKSNFFSRAWNRARGKQQRIPGQHARAIRLAIFCDLVFFSSLLISFSAHNV